MPSRKNPGDVSVVRTAPSPTRTPLRILLLKESEADAELIKSELQRAGMTTMTGRVDSVEEFTAALRTFAPDVVLADHPIPRFDSSAMEIMRSVSPTTPFIIVADSLTGAQSVGAIRSGVEDLVLKPFISRLPTSISEALAIRRPLHSLTERQVEVLRLVAEGHRTRSIADKLGLSVKTVESHRGEIMKRLRVHDVVSLVRYAIRVGLVTLPS
jgi:DNA-binding NarL/FixJ family response regulator